MDQMSLFDEMFAGAFGEDVPKIEPLVKKEEKKPAKKASSKKEAPKISLPVEVIASSWKKTIEKIRETTEATLDEIKNALVEEGYVELDMYSANLTNEDGKVVASFASTPSSGITPILCGGNDNYRLAQGQFTMTLDKEELGDDAKVAGVAAKWEEQYPQFADCKIINDIGKGIGYPIAGTEVTEAVPAGTIQYFYDGMVQNMELAEKTTAEQVVLKITGATGGKLYKSGDVYFALIVRTNVKKNASSSTKSTAPAAKPKEEQKFILPFTVTFTHADDMKITATTFPGKTEVTEKELQQYLLTKYEEYTEDKTEFIYFKKDAVVEARIRSAKRG